MSARQDVGVRYTMMITAVRGVLGITGPV
jgi:hypothetical protein